MNPNGGATLVVTAAAVLAGIAAAVTSWLAGGRGSTFGVGAAVAVVVALVALAVSWRARVRARAIEAIAEWTVSLAVAALLADAALVLVLGRLPRGPERDLVVPAVAAAAVVLMAGAGLRRRVRAWASPLVRGHRRAPDDVVRAFVDRAGQGGADLELFLDLADSLQRTYRLAAAEVWLRRGGMLELAVSVPDRPIRVVPLDEASARALAGSRVAGTAFGEMWLPGLVAAAEARVVPAVFAGNLLGAVVLTRPAGAEPFTAADDLVLAELGRRVGVVLRNRQLDAALQTTLDDLRHANEELRSSRTRLVVAADAERRRIERDLHDGAQQHLVALAVNLRLARDLLDGDVAPAREVLDQLVHDVQETIQEVRELAHGIYPPLLADAGLAAALRTAANRSPLAVAVDVPPDRFDRDVEAAVYFCCVEALQNAAKHAPGADVEVKAWTDGGALRFCVADDGPGFDPAAVRHGHGLQNMRDRVGAIGGAVEWETRRGGGTRVEGSLPLEIAS